jgi:undecaprenyl-diphosphatase
VSAHLSYFEASAIGLLQGVSELFPVSSLGHSVLIPAIIGGSWRRDLSVNAPESPYLAFIVGLHVATAAALILYFWRDWVRIVTGLCTSIRYRRLHTPNERLAWLLILATIPVGVAGLLLEHIFRTTLARPTPTAVFLIVNGLVLLGAERLRRGTAEQIAAPPQSGAEPSGDAPAGRHAATAATRQRVSQADPPATTSDARLAGLRVRDAVVIGAAQIAALAPGISRFGTTMATGLVKGLRHDDAARFAFLLATPVILAAGVLKLPDLAGPLGAGIRGPVLLGSLLSFLGAYLSVRFLSRYFRTNSLRPFGYYCLAFGTVALVVLNI